VALVGDQTFLYDSNGLLVPADEERPDLVIVVSDNDGGGIFSTLEQGRAIVPSVFERVFGNPLGIDIAVLAATLGIPAVTVDTVAGLVEAVDDALGAGGVRVVVARTCPRDREAEILAEVQRAVDSALEYA
jgi:2-succinyl-5-enolpyruvyl-6-hydroxy-3-cyclohexene-1-carboxylate synthase